MRNWILNSLQGKITKRAATKSEQQRPSNLVRIRKSERWPFGQSSKGYQESCNSNHRINQSEKQHLEKQKQPQFSRWIEDEQWKTGSRGHWLIRVNKWVDSSLRTKAVLSFSHCWVWWGSLNHRREKKKHANKNVFHIFQCVYLLFSRFKLSEENTAS